MPTCVVAIVFVGSEYIADFTDGRVLDLCAHVVVIDNGGLEHLFDHHNGF